MNYYERHIGDYLKDTAHLSLLEHGIYGRLLDVYYTRESAIPVAQAERLIGVRSRDEKAALANVLEEFFVVDVDANVLRHTRCDKEIARYQDKQRKASASANARWNKGQATPTGDAKRMRTHMRTHSEGNAPSNQTPDTSNQNQGALVESQQAGGQPFGPDGPARAGFENDSGSGSGSGSPAGVAAAAMAQAGLADASAGHPGLRALVAGPDGLTVDELRLAAVDAVAQGKGFAWALKRAEGRRRDAAAMGALPSAGQAVDPDSRQAVEADAERLGIGQWDQGSEHWPAYRKRVRLAQAGGVGEVSA